MKIDRSEVVKAIINRMDALHLRHAIVFHPATMPAAPPYIPLAEALADGLALGNNSVVTVVHALLDDSDRRDERFWAMDLGRLLFLAGGFRGDAVSQKITASLLGCSRQYVHALVTSGKLRSEPSEHLAARMVNVRDVCDLLRAKIDKEVN